MKKIAVNAKHLLVKNMLKCLSVYTLKSKDATSHHPTVDMLTKPSFITDSQPSMHGPSVTLIRRLVQNTLENPISPQTYIHLVLRIYTSSYQAKKKLQHDMRVYSVLLKRGLISLSFMEKTLNLTVTSMSHMMPQPEQ